MTVDDGWPRVAGVRRRSTLWTIALSFLACACTTLIGSGVTSASRLENKDAVRETFVRAYRAWDANQPGEVVKLLGPLDQSYPQLGDYVLFYLGVSERMLGRAEAAEEHLGRLLKRYPESVFRHRAELELARTELTLSHPGRAEQLVKRTLSGDISSALRAQARFLLAQALVARGDFGGAGRELMRIRQEFPRAPADADARRLLGELRREHPALLAHELPVNHLEEAELLLSEGEWKEAMREARAAERASKNRDERLEAIWIQARAANATDRKQGRSLLLRYLKLAPLGPAAPLAWYRLGLSYWHTNELDRARSSFRHVYRTFPEVPIAKSALLRVGWIAEEQRDFERARRAYALILARYSSGEEVAQARFRTGWALYREQRYASAARWFRQQRRYAASPSERDRFVYWEARALEGLGARQRARQRFKALAESTGSNYYPALAARALNAPEPRLQAASASLPRAPEAPPSGPHQVRFHIERALELKSLKLNQLAGAELMMLRRFAFSDARFRDFLLAELHATENYYFAIKMAAALATKGALPLPIAERLRYPRAYWELFQAVAEKNQLDPALLLAVARQESLFNPRARSAANALGLMQLLQPTAERVTGRKVTEEELFDPLVNARLGGAELARLLRRFNGDVFRAIAAYNAGERAVERWDQRLAGLKADEWVESIDYRETRNYVKAVIGTWREYRMLYDFPQTAQCAGVCTPRRFSVTNRRGNYG